MSGASERASGRERRANERGISHCAVFGYSGSREYLSTFLYEPKKILEGQTPVQYGVFDPKVLLGNDLGGLDSTNIQYCVLLSAFDDGTEYSNSEKKVNSSKWELEELEE